MYEITPVYHTNIQIKPSTPVKDIIQLFLVHIYKKDVGSQLLLVHILRLWHCLFVETSNAEAHAEYVYKRQELHKRPIEAICNG